LFVQKSNLLFKISIEIFFPNVSVSWRRCHAYTYIRVLVVTYLNHILFLPEIWSFVFEDGRRALINVGWKVVNDGPEIEDANFLMDIFQMTRLNDRFVQVTHVYLVFTLISHILYTTTNNSENVADNFVTVFLRACKAYAALRPIIDVS